MLKYGIYAHKTERDFAATAVAETPPGIQTNAADGHLVRPEVSVECRLIVAVLVVFIFRVFP